MKEISNASGHYQPKASSLLDVVNSLQKMGADLSQLKLNVYWQVFGDQVDEEQQQSIQRLLNGK